MGNYGSLPAEISPTNKNWDKNAKTNFNTALDRHRRGRDVLQYLGNKLPENVRNALVSKLNDTRNRYNDCHNAGFFCNRDNMNNTGNNLNGYVDDVLNTYINDAINDYQGRVDTAIQNNAKFKNYSDVYGGNVIPQGEIDTANQLIQNFRNARSRGNAAQATTVDNLISKWNGLNNNNPVAQKGLVDKAREAKTNADNKIKDFGYYNKAFQGKINEFKELDSYKNFDWYWNDYHNNLSNGTHSKLDSVSNQLNEAVKNYGGRYAQQWLIDHAETAKKAANDKIADLELYGNYQDRANTLRDSPAYKNIDWYKDVQYLGNTPNNATHADLETVTNELNEAVKNAGYRAANDKGLLDRATIAKDNANAKIEDLRRYGDYFKDIINTLANSAAYKDRQFYWDDYHRTPTNTTHQNLENSTTDLNKAVAAADRAVEIKGNIDRAVAQVNRAKEINQKLAQAYSKKYGSNYINYNINNIEQLIQNYINDPNNDTNRVNIQGNTAGLDNIINASDQTPKINQGLIDAANTAIGNADAKNATLNNYWEYNDRNKYPRIDTGPLINARDAYNGNPTNTTHDDLVAKTDEVNNSNVTKVTAHPHFVQAAQNEINTAISKNAQLAAYNNFYPNKYNNYEPLKAELTAFEKNPSSSLHLQMFGNNGNNNYEKLRLLNAGTNITPNADLMTKADTAKEAAKNKIADLETYNKYGNYQDRANTLKGNNAGALADFMIYYNQYNDNKTNQTHQNLETKTNELKTATDNAGGRSPDQNLIIAANTALGTANAKNKTLDDYVDYRDRNQFPRIDTGPLIAARDAYNVNPTNTTHDALVTITTEINGKNVAQITAHPYSAGLIQTEIDTAIQKNAQLVAYSDAYGNVAQNDYKLLEAQFVEFKAKPNTALHDVIFGIGGNPKGNYDIVKEKNQSINITPSADLISKAREQIKEGNAKSQVYQQNPAYVNFASSLTKPIQDCADALTEYERVQNNTTAKKLEETTTALKTAINDVPAITTPKPTPNRDLLSKAEIQLDAGDKLSKLLQNNTYYVNFVSSLTTPINNCTAAYAAYEANPNDTTAKQLDDTTTALKTAIGEVPTITTPKPTPNRDLLSRADTQLDGGSTLKGILENNPGYSSYASSLALSITNCQTAYDAYKDNSNDTTANNLVDTTEKLKTEISKVPIVTTSIPTTPYATTPYATTPYATTPYDTTPYASTPYASTPYATTPYDTTPYASTPYASTPYASIISTSEVTMHPDANPIVVTNIKIQIDSAIAFANEIKNYSQSNTEGATPDLESQINDATSKYNAYKINPTNANLSALVQSANNLSETVKSLQDVPISSLISNAEFAPIIGSLSSVSTQGPTSSVSATSTASAYGPTSTASAYGSTASLAPGTTYGPTSSASTYGPIASLAPGTTYGPTSSASTYGPTSSASTYGPTSSTSAYVPTININSLAYNAMDNVPRPTFNYEIVNSVGARPTFNYAIANASPNNYGSVCPTLNCAPYQTTVPPTTPPHKCKTCQSCRRCHKCNKHHKCHRKTPTNTTNITNKR